MAFWYVRSGATGTASGASWTDAKTTLAAALAVASSGDTFWLADDHSESQSTNLTLASPGTISNPCLIFSVDHTVANPVGVASALKVDNYTLGTTACATITTSVSATITFTGIAFCRGVVFNAGTGANAPAITNTGPWTFQDCSYRKLGTLANSGAFVFSVDGTILINHTFQFSHGGDRIVVGGLFQWLYTNQAPALLGSTIPPIFIRNGSTIAICRLDCIDLSNMVSGSDIFQAGATASMFCEVVNCIFDSSFNTMTTAIATRTALVNTFETALTSTTTRQRLDGWQGAFNQNLVVVRTGGTSDGVTAWSWDISTTSDAKFEFPFQTWPIPVFNTTTGVSVTVTVYGIINAAALPRNDELWIDAIYQGSTTTPIGAIKTSAKSNSLAASAALTSDISAWDTNVPSRANTTPYVLNQTIKLASNPGRVFYCTTAGTSAASEPAGYASAVDGGSVTDGGAVFRAGMRFLMSVVLTSPVPRAIGGLRIKISAGKASGAWTVDPSAYLS
jgi:hypothetical protein